MQTQPQPSSTVENSPTVDDTQTVLVSSHVLIKDRQTGNILLNRRAS
jgi:hypothetical protein